MLMELFHSFSRPIGGMTMLSLLEAYLKQVRDTLHDVVKILKEESKKPPKPCKKVGSNLQRQSLRGI